MSVIAVLLALVLPVVRPAPTEDIRLQDAAGHAFRLSDSAAGRPLLVALLRVDCPLAGRYAPRLCELHAELARLNVPLLVVNADPTAEPPATAAFARDHHLPFPIVADPAGSVARALGANRSPMVFLLDETRRIRYRGRIDDQYEAGGLTRVKPASADCLEAVRELVAGQPVRVPVTPATGCVIDPPESPRPVGPRVTYTADVAPILRKHCADCHQPGENAPFSLLSYSDAKRRSGTIAEVLGDGRMPPWHAAPGAVRFRNDRSLPASLKQTVLRWIDQGCAEGSADVALPAPAVSGKWKIGVPDAVFSIPERFNVPATGLVEYQCFRVDPGFKKDAWVRAIEIRPGNHRVVHHCSVFVKPADAPLKIEQIFEIGGLGSFNLVAWTPGTAPAVFPPGMAKRIPVGWTLHFVMHYTTVGSPQQDQTELGVLFADPREVRQEVATKFMQDLELIIPPHAARHRVENVQTFDRDVLLLAMFPHMHLRGRSFQYEARYPDGRRELLLDVPAYDFNWQHRYELEEPKRLPAGTTVHCVAIYDNSAANPANPDPNATVREGRTSSDEMFNAYFDVVLADEDLTELLNGPSRIKLSLVWAAVAIVAVVGGVVSRRQRRSPHPASTFVTSA